LDYSKADLWASGALCYEFFSLPNPFFHGSLRQETYDDQKLPTLAPLALPIIERLAHSMLCKNPKEVFIKFFLFDFNFKISFLS
jgi:hypothetical protein